MSDRIPIFFPAALFIAILVERRCENFTGDEGCWAAGREPLAAYGVDQMCGPCMARLTQVKRP